MKEFEALQIGLDDKIHKNAALYPDVPGFVMLNVVERAAWLANYREQKRHEVELLSMNDMEREEALDRCVATTPRHTPHTPHRLVRARRSICARSRALACSACVHLARASQRRGADGGEGHGR